MRARGPSSGHTGQVADGIANLMPGVPCERREARTCSLRVWRPTRTVLVSEVVGHLDPSTARVLESYVPRVAQEDGLVTGFHDWRAMTDYDSESRTLLTEAILRNLRYIDVAHIATHSRLVAFGVRAAGALIG